MDAFDLDAGVVLEIGDGRTEGVAVEGIAMQRLGAEHELTAPGFGHRRCQRDPNSLGDT